MYIFLIYCLHRKTKCIIIRYNWYVSHDLWGVRMQNELSYYGSDHQIPPVETILSGIQTHQDLYRALRRCWCAETCAPRMRRLWTPGNPTWGQCSITSFLAQDLFGGVVRGVALPDGGFHCFNEVNGVVFDLTSEQFGDKRLNYVNCPEQYRATHFAMNSKQERYFLLWKLLREYLAENGGPAHA